MIITLTALSVSVAAPDMGSSSAWQACVTRTAEDWSSLKVSPEVIADAAIIHCRREMENYMIDQVISIQSKGVPKAEAEKLASGLGALLMQMIRGFAVEAVGRGRAIKP